MLEIPKERILIMDFMEKAYLAAKLTVPDAQNETIRYVYAHDGKIFSTNGFTAFVTMDENVNNFKGLMHPFSFKKKDELEFENFKTPEQEKLLDFVEETITQHLITALNFPDANILNIEDYKSTEAVIELNPELVMLERLEKEKKKTKKKKEPEETEESNEDFDVIQEDKPKRTRKAKTERKVIRNYSTFTLQNETEKFPIILNKDMMLDIINTYKGLPTLKASNSSKAICIKRNDNCGLTDDIYYLIMPYKPELD